jgi:predicted DNA-binding ribbon-helix-helix protein
VSKRSITIAGHRTSVSLEEPFWQALGEAAAADGKSIAAIIADVDRRRGTGLSLSAALRLHILAWARAKGPAGRD